MARIKIVDLPKNMKINRKELKKVLGGISKSTGDIHDRYANQETSYLLERVEMYNGITILTSNFRKDSDS